MPTRLRRLLMVSGAARFLFRKVREWHRRAWHEDICHSLKRCGSNVRLEYPVAIHHPDSVEFGEMVHVAEFVHIWGGCGVTIGTRVMIGSHTAISAVTHDYNEPCMYTTRVTRPVFIGDDVWIGSHVVILPGVTVGTGAVVGAGAVVTRDVPPATVVAGIPARVIRVRPTFPTTPLPTRE